VSIAQKPRRRSRRISPYAAFIADLTSCSELRSEIINVIDDVLSGRDLDETFTLKDSRIQRTSEVAGIPLKILACKTLRANDGSWYLEVRAHRLDRDAPLSPLRFATRYPDVMCWLLQHQDAMPVQAVIRTRTVGAYGTTFTISEGSWL
jgi:hypothetical protein